MSAAVQIVLCAGGAAWEAPLVRALQHQALGIELVRRCVDHGELLGVALRDRPMATVLSADLPWLDRDLVGTLEDHGIAVIVIGPDEGRDRLEQIGVGHHLGLDVSAEVLAARLHVVAGARPEADRPEREPDATEPRRGRLSACGVDRGALVDHVVIHRAHKRGGRGNFNPERVEPVWRI